MEYTSVTLRLQAVRQYIELRKTQPKDINELVKYAGVLLTFFSPDGVVIDTSNHTHTFLQLMNYFQEPTPTLESIGDPKLLPDGRIVLEFSVNKMWVKWPIKAYFTFKSASCLIQELKIERVGLF